jgi:hypothetical protein
VPYSLKVDRLTLTRCGSCLNYVFEMRRVSRFLVGTHLSSRQRGCDILAWLRIKRGARHCSQIMGDAHLFDEGPASPANRQMKSDVEARPEAELAIDQKAGALGHFTASKH